MDRLEPIINIARNQSVQLSLGVALAVIIGLIIILSSGESEETNERVLIVDENTSIVLEEITDDTNVPEATEVEVEEVEEVPEVPAVVTPPPPAPQPPVLQQPASGGPLTEAEKAQLVAAHNSERAAVGVSPLTWSETLAASAGRWADQLQSEGCQIRHSDTQYGENLYWAFESVPNLGRVATPATAVGWWNAEKRYYTYSSNSCAPGQQCGHYTQNIWSDTTEVGCAQRSCFSGDGTREVWVCQYNPPGNFIGERPY